MNAIDRYVAEFPDDRSLTPLTDVERAAVMAEIGNLHRLDFQQTFFWTGLTDHRLLITDDHHGLDFLAGLLPEDADVVLFDCDDLDHGFRTRYRDAVRVIGESSYFEYLIYALDTGQLIVENDHNELFVAQPPHGPPRRN